MGTFWPGTVLVEDTLDIESLKHMPTLVVRAVVLACSMDRGGGSDGEY